MTQFGRALSELNIEILSANSSQAKGRVERSNRTLQDRLVKELRLAGISGMEAGNASCEGSSSVITNGSLSVQSRQTTCIVPCTFHRRSLATSCAIANSATWARS
jgi:hypothetical protein